MATPIEMPKPGVTVDECLLVKWAKRKGDVVSAGDLIAEIETDKATFEINAPVAGTLLETFAAEGELVPVYTNVCVIGEPGENAEGFRPAAKPATIGTTEAPPADGSTVEQPLRAAGSAQTAFSPRARRFLEQHRFQPGVITGSGPGGRILRADVERAFRSGPRVSPLAAEYVAEGYEVAGEGSGPGGMILARDLAPPGVKLSTMRERIARRMRESLASTAQYTLTSSADATGLLALRSKIKAARQESAIPDINLNEMVMFCAAQALRTMPELNAELVDGKLYQRANINMGFACDTPRGLLVPVVKECQGLTLAELALKVKALSQQAVDGNISPDDLGGATFTVSNLGNLGIESFTPLLNPPQVAILGVNAIDLRPVRRDGSIEFVDRIGFSLTVDHQVIDGAPGARFLLVLREQVENIEGMAGLNL